MGEVLDHAPDLTTRIEPLTFRLIVHQLNAAEQTHTSKIVNQWVVSQRIARPKSMPSAFSGRSGWTAFQDVVVPTAGLGRKAISLCSGR